MSIPSYARWTVWVRRVPLLLIHNLTVLRRYRLYPSPCIRHICSDYAVDNDIMLNQKKSQCVVFKPDKFKLSSPDIVLDSLSLKYVDDIKYLGVVLNNLCRDDSDMKRHLRSLYAKYYTIIRKFHNCSLDVKLTLFRAYCLPSYCCHSRFRYKNSTLTNSEWLLIMLTGSF